MYHILVTVIVVVVYYFVIILLGSLSPPSLSWSWPGAGGRASIGGIKGACPAPLITPQSAQADWGAGFPAPPEPKDSATRAAAMGEQLGRDDKVSRCT